MREVWTPIFTELYLNFGKSQSIFINIFENSIGHLRFQLQTFHRHNSLNDRKSFLTVLEVRKSKIQDSGHFGSC